MVDVKHLHALAGAPVGMRVHASGLLIGGGVEFFLADSIEDFDARIAIPLLDKELFERMFVRGIFPVGGGRFGFCCPCIVSAVLAPSVNGYKYSLKDIVSLVVTYNDKELLVVPDTPGAESCAH